MLRYYLYETVETKNYLYETVETKNYFGCS